MLEDKGNIVLSVIKATELIEKLSENDRSGMGVTELSKELGLTKSNVSRLLKTLQLKGYVQKQKDARYRLSLKLLEVCGNMLDARELTQEAHSSLIELARNTRQTVHLGVLDNESVVYIDKVDGNRYIKMNSYLGKRVSVHCAALGKAILSQLPEEEVRSLLARVDMERRTEWTITDADRYIEELRLTKRRGYAIDNQENEPNIICIAVYIPVGNMQPQYALSVSVPSYDVRIADGVEELVARITQTASVLSKTIGSVARFV